MSQARLYLDEDARGRSFVFGLRARNIDVLTASEANMINRDDHDHLAPAAKSGRSYTSSMLRTTAFFIRIGWVKAGNTLVSLSRLSSDTRPARNCGD